MNQNTTQTPKPCNTPCEVYSRIVGYYSPVSNWNRGKREEFAARRGFKMAAGKSAATTEDKNAIFAL